MTRRCFTKLCNMLHTLGGLTTSRHMDIDEQVAIFLHIIAHNVKTRVMIGRFHHSGETISRIFTRVCNAVIRLHPQLLKKPEPVTENSTDQRWKWFKVMEKGRKYHNWTINEDAKLVEVLEKIPESCLMGKPHIESRIKTMKKDWQIVYDMVNGTNTSGFGYDSSTHSVTTEPTVWESYIQVHKEAGKWRNNIFPHLRTCVFFGKDRAQGNKAKDFAEMEEDANNEEQDEEIDIDPDLLVEEDANNTSTHTKKRKSIFDLVVQGITIAANVLGEKLEKAASSTNQAILGETDVQKKASMVISKVSKMQSLSALDRFKASRKIMCDPETVLSFWNLEGEDRENLVMFMLHE
ncbi:unnamed protein product [Lactuca saligna]|uniref:Myb/SANT-like domain-containing protein n=1 Tax=Lactuca saligna TaxID=75948 RepID=A0AA35ZQW7_LACSI|nr:unnamed protein product [Lactuca saligna]